MNRRGAQQILLLYRPGTSDGTDPEVAEALAALESDAELRRWFDAHCAFQQALQRKFRQLPVPDDLKQRILAGRRIIPLRVERRRVGIWAAAAALVLLLGVMAVWLSSPRPPDRFEDFRVRMVRTALREYRLDVVTNDMAAVRQFMAQGGAPADYVVPDGLGRVPLAGGGLLKWRGHPVSMVCFDRGNRQMLYLFVLDRAAVKNAPPSVPQVAKVNKLVTASWSRGNRAYVLAGPDEPDFARKYL